MADVVGESPDVPVEAVHECFEPAARADRGELSRVADEHELRPGMDAVVEEPAQVVVVGHACFVEDHHAPPIEADTASVETGREGRNGVRLDRRVTSDRACGLAAGGGADDSVAVVFVRDADGGEGGGLAGPGDADHDIEPAARPADSLHRRSLTRGQPVADRFFGHGDRAVDDERRDRQRRARMVPTPSPFFDGTLRVEHTLGRPHPFADGPERFQLDRLRVQQDSIDDPVDDCGVETEQARCVGDDHVTSTEHLVISQSTASSEEVRGEPVEAVVVQLD